MSKIKDWLEPDKLILLEGWARDGLTEEQIAKNIGIDKATLYRWKIKECSICNALKKGKEVIDFEVENALLKRALGYTITINEQKIDKDGCVHDTKKDVHIPGDTTAQIFWLKNRKKEQWREKQEINNEQEKEISKVEELLNKIEKEAENDIK